MKFLFLLLVLVPIISSERVLKLSSKWFVSHSNGSMLTETQVPGGIYSDLKSILGDILYGNRDEDYKWVGRSDWTYHTEFTVSAADLKHKSVWLVLHGVDTIGEVYLNDRHILSCNNMFVRYNVNIKYSLVAGNNRLVVSFKSPVLEAERLTSKQGYVVPPNCPPPSYHGECHVNMLRKMQASFSWDWGPSFPSVGLWKPVEIVFTDGPQIESITVKTELQKDTWLVTLTAWFGPSLFQFSDNLVAHFYWSEDYIRQFSVPITTDVADRQSHSVSFLLPKSDVKLWWPNGYGEQNLYKVEMVFKQSQKSVNIGFRTIRVMEPEVTNGKMFYVEVNGQAIFAKGTNWIPSSVMPEHSADEDRVPALLEDTAKAYTNMIRVWGGGIYESDLFYETCDRLGIMVWQDMLFACSMYPTYDEYISSVKVEIEQQVQRLQHHPSLAVWAGNNENEGALMDNWYGTSSNFERYIGDYVKLYVETIKPIVEAIDDTRPYFISSPSSNIGNYTSKPGNPLYGDVHYYNYADNGWDPRIYPNPRFASEYGSYSLPSYECLKNALPPNQTYWGSPYVERRIHAPDGNKTILSQIYKNLPTSKDIKDIIYLSQINQAMATKVESEKYRRLQSFRLTTGEGFTMGALYWQINDIWPSPSWSAIDYCGNWKMLQYYAFDFFAPIIVSPEMSSDEKQISLYVIVDGAIPYKDANLVFNTYRWDGQSICPDKTFSKKVSLIENRSVNVQNMLVKNLCPDKQCFYTTKLQVKNFDITPENFLFHLPLRQYNYPETFVEVAKLEVVDKHSARLILHAKGYALFVWLNVEGVQGRFSKNGFHMMVPTSEVTFVSKEDISKLTSDKVSVTWLKKSYPN
ncbi:beta-mannosidase [Halyomorpha halys]|uniref:beta-mannosidase n=1 Tax=Halyomorpha halys TaxID=286706 RepID=UPI0006D4E2A2|nr:beta-mannosidase [Halyomorpha halys]